LYLPAAQSTQSPAVAEKYPPAGHCGILHALLPALLPAAEYFPKGQSVQVVTGLELLQMQL